MIPHKTGIDRIVSMLLFHSQVSMDKAEVANDQPSSGSTILRHPMEYKSKTPDGPDEAIAMQVSDSVSILFMTVCLFQSVCHSIHYMASFVSV